MLARAVLLSASLNLHLECLLADQAFRLGCERQPNFLICHLLSHAFLA